MLRETTPEHMPETLVGNFVIDANINIGNTQSFNIYTAQSHTFDVEDVESIFLKGQMVKFFYMEENDSFQNAVLEAGTFGIHYKNTYTKQYSIYYDNQYMNDRSLHYYCQPQQDITSNQS